MHIHLSIKYFMGLLLLLSNACVTPPSTSPALSTSVTTSPLPSHITPLPSLSHPFPQVSPSHPVVIMSPSPTQPTPPNIIPSASISASPITKFQGGGGGSGSYVSQTSEFRIDNVFLSSPGTSVMGANASASLSPDYEATAPINLIVQGHFPNTPVLTLEQMHFTHEPGLLHLSFLPDELPHHLVLNHSIALKPISVSPTQITATLHPRGLPDLYFKGLHTLTLKVGNQTAERQIKVGDPLRAVNLNPVIHSVLYDNDQHPTHLKLTGQHFMVQPSLNYVQVDGIPVQATRASVQQTETGLQSNLWIPIPNPDTFDPHSDHELLYITSFGVALANF